MFNKSNWERAKINFTKWWNNEDAGRPLMRIIANDYRVPFEPEYTDPKVKYLSVDFAVNEFYHTYKEADFFCEAFPQVSMNIGPGSYASYLGAEPNFTPETVWYEECISSYRKFGQVKYDPNNIWLRRHLKIISDAKKAAGDDFIVCIPDIVENIDILAAMRGPQKLLVDMMDHPNIVKKNIKAIDDNYFNVYDRFYDIVKDDDGGSAFTAFNIWGGGKTAKVQCDFAAMISPKHFREFVLPTLDHQCNMLDYSIYHLDGPDCIAHIPALMEMKGLNALQWTAGAGQLDGANPKWFPIYEQVKKAGKALWVEISDGGYNEWVESADNFIKEFGREGVYFLFPIMTHLEARGMMEKCYKSW